MERIVEELSDTYDEFVAAAASVLETKDQSSCQKTPAIDATLKAVKQRWELFRVACDQEEEFVELMKQRIGSECLVNEAVGATPSKLGSLSATPGISQISVVRLE